MEGAGDFNFGGKQNESMNLLWAYTGLGLENFGVGQVSSLSSPWAEFILGGVWWKGIDFPF